MKGFNKEEWSLVAKQVMERGLELKFAQNSDLKEYLLSTNNKMLVEASPTDRYWGIGFGLSSNDLFDMKKWGQNHLGQLLMIIRNKLKS